MLLTLNISLSRSIMITVDDPVILTTWRLMIHFSATIWTLSLLIVSKISLCVCVCVRVCLCVSKCCISLDTKVKTYPPSGAINVAPTVVETTEGGRQSKIQPVVTFSPAYENSFIPPISFCLFLFEIKSFDFHSVISTMFSNLKKKRRFLHAPPGHFGPCRYVRVPPMNVRIYFLFEEENVEGSNRKTPHFPPRNSTWTNCEPIG